MMRDPAKAIEARSDETRSGSAVGESAVALAIRPDLTAHFTMTQAGLAKKETLA